MLTDFDQPVGPVVDQPLALAILLELLHPVATLVIAPGGLFAEANAVVWPLGDGALPGRAGLALRLSLAAAAGGSGRDGF